MSSWREASLVGNSSVRAKSRFPWLLLLWWSQATLWLRRWLKIYLRRPLMRLGIVSTDSNDQTKGELPENDVDASSSDGKNRHTESELPCGLVNTSNLCFVNAVLQCLAAVPRFVDSVDRALRTRTQLHAPLVTQSDDDQVQKLLVAETLVSVLRGISAVGEDEETRELEQEQMQMQVENGGKRRRTEGRQGFGGTRRDDTMQRMRRFRAAASRCTYLVSSAVSRQEQQDAEEFLSFLLELIHDLLKCPADPRIRSEEERQQFLQSEQWFLKKLKSYDPNDPRSYMHAVAKLGEARWNYFLRQNASVITDLFAGQTVRGSQCCSCANLTCLHEAQRVISLAIDPSKDVQSLAECLEHFRHPEQLTGENRVYCDGYCHAKTTRLTQILLQRVPPVLVLRLQRFQHTSTGLRAEKVDTAVSFPCRSEELLDLTMNAFFRDEAKHIMFQLVGVCAHLGTSIDSGHYVAYIRHHLSMDNHDQWLRIDDDVVSVIDEATLQSETLRNAYLLFYAKAPR